MALILFEFPLFCLLEHLSSTWWGWGVMVAGCDYFHSSGGYSSFVTRLLEGLMARYSTRVGIIACSPMHSLLLCVFPTSITLLSPPPLSLHLLRLYRRLSFPPQGSLGPVLRELDGGWHDSHWHWQRFTDSFLMPTVRWTGKHLNKGRRPQREADGERQGRSEVVLELSWWFVHPHTLNHAHTLHRE